MLRSCAFLLVFFGSAGAIFGQPLDESALSGRYHFVELLIRTTEAGVAQGASDLAGEIVFDGVGGFTVNATRGVDGGAGSAFTFTGAYLVDSSGFVFLNNPLNGDLTLNSRLGQGGEVLLGTSTEALDGTQDFFVAVRAPSADVSAGVLSGPYAGASVWLPNGVDDAAKTALIEFDADGAGALSRFDIDGHAADLQEEPVFEARAGSYTVGADGSGTMALTSASSLVPADRTLFVSDGGDYVIGFSEGVGARDVFVALRKAPGVTSTADLSGTYWILDLFIDRGFRIYESAIGGLRSSGDGTVSIAQRVGSNPLKTDFSGVNFYSLGSDATGFLRGFAEPGVENFAIGGGPAGSGGQVAPPQSFVGAEVFQSRLLYTVHGLTFGVRVPEFTPPAEAPYLQPLGALNAASFAPATNPVSGGTLLSLFGSNLSTGTSQATSTPLPTNLGGVTVTVNGVAAPLFFVSPGQINLQTPFGLSGVVAEIQVTRNGTASNVIEVPIAPTSPGVFSLLQNGIGPGAITHADFQIVSEQNPAAPGEVVLIFLTGLGEVSPPFADGAAGPSDPLSTVVDDGLGVEFGDQEGTILFAGAAPGFVGLYQINVQLPQTAPVGAAVPLTVITTDAVSDYVDIAIQ